MSESPKDIGASVRARLLNLARERGQDYQLLLTRHANERFLYRLSRSPHGESFVLKGAALFTLWTGAPHRTTRDLDLLGFGEASESRIRAVLVEILSAGVEADGVHFDGETLEVGPIRADQAYAGIRAVLTADIAGAKVRLQIDIGFGDAITPEATAVEYPTLLEFPAPRLRAYPKETVVAEKVEAMVQLGIANSRMKDFFDLLSLSGMFPFDGHPLVSALKATFERRQTQLPESIPLALTPEFARDHDKTVQWSAFLRKTNAASPRRLEEVTAAISEFLAEPLLAAALGHPFQRHWSPGGPWA